MMVLNAYYVPSPMLRILHRLLSLYNHHHHFTEGLLSAGTVLMIYKHWLWLPRNIYDSSHLLNTSMYRCCARPCSYIVVRLDHTPTTFLHFPPCFNCTGILPNSWITYIFFWPQGLCTCSSIRPCVNTATFFTSCRLQPHCHFSNELFSDRI